MAGSEEEAFEALLLYIRESRGFDFTGYKRPSLIRRISKRMEAVGIQAFNDYQDYLQVHPEEFTSLFNFVLINVTSFFRDTPVWDFIEAETIPRILRQKGSSEQIRVWCAGAASGEEAYSVAMLLAEGVGRDRFAEQVKIYATDVDDDALLQARQAAYAERQVEAIPPRLLETYFERIGGTFTFDRDLRRAVIFGHHDLVKDAPISKVDLLLCRNTLMYFNTETQAKVMSHFHFALNRGGFLVLGKAEMLTHSRTFVPVELKQRVFTKMDGGEDGRDRVDRTAHVRELAMEPPVERRQGRELAFDSSPTAQILIDEKGLLVLANNRARDSFGLAANDLGRPFQDLQISYRPIDIRSPIEQSGRERQPVMIQSIPWTLPGGDEITLDIEVTPLLDAEGRPISFSVTFTDVTRFRQIQTELRQSNQELETAMEELQSTNEELETTNEELQSTNEELETTNEELQSTNEELETTNEEFRERSTELDELNAFLEGILTGVQVGVVVLDGNERVSVWNRRAEEMWGLSEDQVTGQRFDQLDIGLPVRELRDRISACLQGGPDPDEVILKATSRRGKPMACRVTCSPYRDLTGAVQGVIVIMEEPLQEPG
jgi:two-component system CheB/CheR fusion protein